MNQKVIKRKAHGAAAEAIRNASGWCPKELEGDEAGQKRFRAFFLSLAEFHDKIAKGGYSKQPAVAEMSNAQTQSC